MPAIEKKNIGLYGMEKMPGKLEVMDQGMLMTPPNESSVPQQGTQVSAYKVNQ